MTDYAERLDVSDIYSRRVAESLAETSMIIIKLCTSVMVVSYISFLVMVLSLLQVVNI
jgi:exoribonuclease II